ncbi:hypothetical protein [Rhizobium mayense]|uniref:hypothetical protein n=1 Tax=Rhizobium mayense TaxID=1312184 RepID=UPI000DDFCE0E
MASEREQAKQSASDPEPSDPDLGETLSTANKFHIDLVRETNRHREKMAHGERGWLGWLVGGPTNAPTITAFLAATAGLVIAMWCLSQAATQGADADFWSKQAEKGFAFAATAVGFIFGRSLK